MNGFLGHNGSGRFFSAGPLIAYAANSLSIKNRYVFTRHNRLRLRYSVFPAMLMLCFLLGAVFSSSPSIEHLGTHKQLALVEPAAGRAEIARAPDDVFEQYAHRQEVLSRTLPQDVSNVVVPPLVPNKIETRTEKMTIGKGDTLTGFLSKAGLDNKEAFLASKAMEKHLDPKHIKPGQTVSVTQRSDRSGRYHLQDMVFTIDPLQAVYLTRTTTGDFTSKLVEKKALRKTYAQSATIDVSLYGSAAKAGIPVSVIAEAIRIFSWDVDFQRDIRRGDKLSLLYERHETEEGVPVKGVNILYASLTVNGHEIPLYRFETSDGSIDYFQPDGRSVRKTLMKTPIDGARISSGFGVRQHPVLGYTKMHKGVDFAAPRGTPIYAAGDGVIEKASRYGSFGHYVRIRHNSSLKTAYAHLNGYGKGISAGVRVKQGQVIGYVGTTGRSTGPHLHYEVLKNGAQVNPNSLDLPLGEILKGEQLARLQTKIKQVSAQYERMIGGARYVSAE